ncbi:hypothetical protein ACFWWM_22115 [Streptomyces sp. NPDC058682]|uniref:hypothetical protein n=1 Tax=Streptomyces sp. NPDC058682 TaxID=3346596 RepID=UPI003652BD37
MNAPYPRTTPSVRGERSARRSRRGRHGAASAVIALSFVALLGCDAAEGGPGGKPSAAYLETPRALPGREPSGTTKEFHRFLLGNEATKDLTTIFFDVFVHGYDSAMDVQIVTGLDHELHDTGSADKEKAERLATAFIAWRTERFKDHGSVKIYNPAIETMVKATW